MIILLDTATPLCKLTLIGVDGVPRTHEWQADRTLAHGLLGYLQDHLTAERSSWSALTGLGVFEGPGSFTGLRIGMAVLNTLADSLQIPIVGARDEAWQTTCLERLRAGENDQIVLPFYGGEANITKPRK